MNFETSLISIDVIIFGLFHMDLNLKVSKRHLIVIISSQKLKNLNETFENLLNKYVNCLNHTLARYFIWENSREITQCCISG